LVVPPLPKIPARYFVDPRDEVKWRKHHLTIERAIVMKKVPRNQPKRCRTLIGSKKPLRRHHITSNAPRMASLNSPL
jgi:hypothetical protein